MSKIVQVRLKNQANEIVTTWVDARPDLKLNVWITLKDFEPGTRWQVIELFGQVHDSAEIDFYRKWDNNNHDHHKGLGI